MRLIRRPSAVAALTLGFATLAGVWGQLLGAQHVAALASSLDRIEMVALDWRYRLVGPRAPPRGVVIAAIDDETVRLAGSFPLPRGFLAQIVRGLAAKNPQVVAVDILLLDPGPPDADQELADALKSTRAVIGGLAIFGSNAIAWNDELVSRGGYAAAIPRPTRILWPQEKFSAVTRTGLSNISTDDSGVPRFVPMLFASGGDLEPSFALISAAAALNTDPVIGKNSISLGPRAVSLDFGYHLPLRFYGPEGSIRTFSAADVVAGKVNDEDLAGQTVVLGVTAAGAGDRFATSFDRSTPGVEIFATAVDNLLAGDGLVRGEQTRRIDAGVAVALAVGSVLLLSIPRVSLALGATLALLAAWLAANVAAFQQGFWFNIAVPAAAVAPAAVVYGFARLWLAQRDARRYSAQSETLRHFHAPGMTDLLTRNPDFLTHPVSQNAAVVFVDLSNFTGVTELLGPVWTRELLAALHDLIEKAAGDHQGYVAGFMGDGAMLVFGLPKPRPDDACRALRAVAQLYAATSNWIASLPPIAKERLRARVGAHSGQSFCPALAPPRISTSRRPATRSMSQAACWKSRKNARPESS